MKKIKFKKLLGWNKGQKLTRSMDRLTLTQQKCEPMNASIFHKITTAKRNHRNR